MDFNWKTTEKELLDKFTTKIENIVNPLVAIREKDNPFTSEEWLALGEIGILGLSAPKEFGGLGLGAANTAMIFEGFGFTCHDMGLLFASGAHLFACVAPIVEAASDELKKQFLPKLISGEMTGANAASEDNAGSDLFSMEMLAERQGDYYILNGKKNFVANAPAADVMVVYAGMKKNPGFFGTSAFVVETKTEGVQTGAPFKMIGLHSMKASEVSFVNCKIPAGNLLGGEGQGGVIFNRSMHWERLGLYAGYVGAMERDLDRVVRQAKKRKQFGKKISKQQAVSHKIVDMKIRLESAKLLLYKACRKFDEGKNCLLDSCLAKIAVSEAAVKSGLDSLSIFGGEGYKSEAGVADSLNDALATLSASGTTDMLREIAASELRL